MTNTEITTKRRKIKSILAPLYLTATLFGSAMFFQAVYKLGDFEKRQRKYVAAVLKPDYGLCSPIASELEQWCQENYFSAKGMALRVMDEIFSIEYPKVKYGCETARHNKVFYQRHIQRFLHQLDQDLSLRQELEEKIYGSEVEIRISVHRDEERYTILYRKDESDDIFRHHFALLRDDKQLQELFMEITKGNIFAVDQYKELIEDVIEREQPGGALEERAREEILTGFQGGDTYDLLILMAENGAGRLNLAEIYRQKGVQLTQIISILQERSDTTKKIVPRLEERQSLLTNTGRMVEAQEYKQQKTLVEQVLQRLNKEIIDYTKKLEETRLEKQKMAQEQDESFQKDSDTFWRALTVDLVNSSILYSRNGREIMDTKIIAEGHTHPYALAIKALKRGHAGPSPNDKETSYRKPELVLAGLEDKWQVYSALCGEATLEREYPRTINPSSAPDTFLNPHLK